VRLLDAKKKMKLGIIGMILSVIAVFILPLIWMLMDIYFDYVPFGDVYSPYGNPITLWLIFGFLISLCATLYYWFKKD